MPAHHSTAGAGSGLHRKVHPAAEVFPLISGDAFEQLKEDIRENGQHEPVVLWKNMLIDGRNRVAACEALGIPVDECEIEDHVDPVAYVLSANLHRRHLTESQRAMVAAKLKGLYEQQAKERQRQSPGRGQKKDEKGPANCPDLNGDSRDQAGEALGISGKSVDRASKVCDHGSTDVVAAVERGELAVSAAAKLVDAVPDKKEQSRLLKQGKSAVSSATKQQKPKPRVRLPGDPTDEEIGMVDKWLNEHDERPFCERFKVLWAAADDIEQAAMRDLFQQLAAVMEDRRR